MNNVNFHRRETGLIHDVVRSLIAIIFVGISQISHSTVIDFDGLADLEAVSSQFPGLTFSHAGILSAGQSLNEFEAPPHSGNNVVTDLNGAIIIEFSSPTSKVSGFVTYSTGLLITAFDSSLNLIDTFTSAFDSNFALSGDLGSAPNEKFEFSIDGIARLILSGSPSGGSFVLDDLSFRGVPEPRTLALTSLGLLLLAAWCKESRILCRRDMAVPSVDNTNIG
jgi:hypothetical protein